MKEIVAEIKSKAELRSLPDTLVLKILNEYLSKNNLSITGSKKERKIIIKEVRAELRKYTGQYASNQSFSKKFEILKHGKINELLGSHASTRERLTDYNEIKKIISAISPKSILDLGCGLNPIAIATPEVRYHAYDINEDDLKLVEEFFRIKGINGDIHHKDITEASVFPEVDLCIIFKVLDILGNSRSRNKLTKSLLEKISSRFFLISFATKTLSGKQMNSPYRRWFEKTLKELKYPYEVRRFSQELVYIVHKK